MRHSHNRLIFSVLISLVLTACGGGSGTPAPPPGTGPDPLYPFQWHLKNTGQITGTQGVDINVEPVWNEGIKGNGVVIAVVDDGLEIAHEDLESNVVPGKSKNYLLAGSTDPTPTNTTYWHGTMVAGVAAARDLNDMGVRGVAPRAGLVGYNIVASNAVLYSSEVTDAMTHNKDIVSVSNNSWGYAADGFGELFPAGIEWEEGIADGIANGRGGKGTVYVWAAGNGYVHIDGNATAHGANVDNSNYDDQANSPYVIPVCSVDIAGEPAYYSEKGANLLICAPAGSTYGLGTTDLMGDRGSNPVHSSIYADEFSDTSYSNSFTGTSAAAPIVSGVIALMLEANPNLTWRDVRLILAEAAEKTFPANVDWSQTVPKAGQPTYNINHNFGFGMIDAAAAVQLAKTWLSVGGSSTLQTVEVSDAAVGATVVPGASATSTLNINDDLAIEFVEVTFDGMHGNDFGEMTITLTAPSGTKSILAEQHDCYSQIVLGTVINCTTDLDGGWTFGTVRHLGESSLGTTGDWELKVENAVGATMDATWAGWSIKVYGRN